MKKSFYPYRALLALSLVVSLGMVSCNLFSSGGDDNDLNKDMISSLESSLLKTHIMLQGGESPASAGKIARSLSASPLKPFASPSTQGTSIKPATINRTGKTDSFADYLGKTTSLPPGYPEPGQTTTFTVTAHPSVANVYVVKATTAYPATSAAETTVEEYYVKDVSPGDDTTPNGIWNQDDPVVDAAGARNSKYRVQYYTKFRDASVRNEAILYDKTTDGIAYAAFDVTASLEYPPVFVPADGTSTWSSVVLYTHTRSSTLNYWFWSGSRYQNTVGVRYYTEQAISEGSAVLKGTTVAFEKTVENFLTVGGTLADSLADVSPGIQNDVLALTVTRQEVKFDSSNSAISKTTYSKAKIYDVSGKSAAYIAKQNDAAATGDVFANAVTDASQVSRTTVIANDPFGVPLVSTTVPSGDVGTLYASIESKTVLSSDGITDAGDSYQFNGNAGILYTDPSDGSYDLAASSGTVEAWVKLSSYQPFAAIVHKGMKEDFSDEAYSLQFWSAGSDLVFVLDKAVTGNSYIIVQAAGKYKALAKNTWYYVVATWNTSKVQLYVNGTLSAEIANSTYPSPGVKTNDAALVIGSQFADNSKVYSGYFGLNGVIDGWKVKKTTTSAEAVLAEYNRVKGL